MRGGARELPKCPTHPFPRQTRESRTYKNAMACPAADRQAIGTHPQQQSRCTSRNTTPESGCQNGAAVRCSNPTSSPESSCHSAPSYAPDTISSSFPERRNPPSSQDNE